MVHVPFSSKLVIFLVHCRPELFCHGTSESFLSGWKVWVLALLSLECHWVVKVEGRLQGCWMHVFLETRVLVKPKQLLVK